MIFYGICEAKFSNNLRRIRKIRAELGRPDLVILVFSFVETGLSDCINHNPVPRGTRDPSSARLLSESDSLRLTRGFQLDLEIALNGVSAKIQPHGLLQPGRRQSRNFE